LDVVATWQDLWRGLVIHTSSNKNTNPLFSFSSGYATIDYVLKVLPSYGWLSALFLQQTRNGKE